MNLSGWKKIDWFQNLKNSEKRTSFLDILGGIIFSAVISLIPSMIFVLILFNQNPNPSVHAVEQRFLVSFVVSFVCIFVVRFFVKGFAKRFSIIIFIILGILFIFQFTMATLSQANCLKHGGSWQAIAYLTTGSSPSPHKCVLSTKNYESLPKSSILHSVFNTLEVKD